MIFRDGFRKFWKTIYRNLVTSDDSPQRIALGFGMGVFLGIFPGAGPIASLALAELFRVNRAAALTGCLLTNTWLSAVAFLLAVKLGAGATQTSWRTVYEQCQVLMRDFHWKELLNASFLKIVYPLAVGYLLVGILCGLLAYVIVWMILQLRQHRMR